VSPRTSPLSARTTISSGSQIQARVDIRRANSPQESAIKFVSYEQSKRFLAKYWDKVSDPSELSSSSRFIAGGIGGITSQFAIYGLETLKTRIQSEVGPSMGWRSVVKQARSMWVHGGIRAYYRGLTVSRNERNERIGNGCGAQCGRSWSWS
jgi:hypothetical protein